MLKSLTLPKGAKEELNYPQEIVEKILAGKPLWDESVKTDEENDEDAEQDESKDKKQMT